jgi:hypothetical protein
MWDWGVPRGCKNSNSKSKECLHWQKKESISCKMNVHKLSLNIEGRSSTIFIKRASNGSEIPWQCVKLPRRFFTKVVRVMFLKLTFEQDEQPVADINLQAIVLLIEQPPR